MEYRVNVRGFEGHRLVVKSAGFFSDPKLFIDCQLAALGPKKGELLLRRQDGQEVVDKLKITNFFDSVPKLVVNEQQIELAPPLKWYQWVCAGLPIALVFVGGAIGGGLGGLALGVNTRIFRSEMNEILKYVAVGCVALGAAIAFLIAAALISLLF